MIAYLRNNLMENKRKQNCFALIMKSIFPTKKLPGKHKTEPPNTVTLPPSLLPTTKINCYLMLTDQLSPDESCYRK